MPGGMGGMPGMPGGMGGMPGGMGGMPGGMGGAGGGMPDMSSLFSDPEVLAAFQVNITIVCPAYCDGVQQSCVF